MKIAILGTRGIPACHGGFETFAEKLSVGLVRRGYEVTVYCEAGSGPQPGEYNGVLLEYLSTPRLGPLTTILFDLRCLWHARRKYDVVYMLGYGTGLFCFIPRLWGTHTWINMDGIEWARSKWNRLAKLWFQFMEAVSVLVPDRLIADAEGIRRHLEKRHGHMSPCSVIPYGAPIIEQSPDPVLLREWGLHPQQYDLVVCRLEPENLVAEVIQGHLRSASRVPLVVVGDKRSGTDYVRSLLPFQSNRVRLIGTVYDTRKLQALRYHARAYLHGHQVGGTNPSLLEALGCGNIVIAHDNVFNREVARDAAFYFRNVCDIIVLLDFVEALALDTQIMMKEAARERIRTAYTWESIVDQYDMLLQSADLAPVAAEGNGMPATMCKPAITGARTTTLSKR